MSTLAKSYLTPEQYLEIERKAEYKSEYYQGERIAMARVRFAHVGIVANAIGLLAVISHEGASKKPPFLA